MLTCKEQRRNLIEMDGQKVDLLEEKMHKNTLEDIGFDFLKGIFIILLFRF